MGVGAIGCLRKGGRSVKKLSIVLPTGSNHHERLRNLKENLACLHRQTFTNWELIVVEQSVDGRFYHDKIPCDTYVPIQDPHGRGYNRSWVRNVGAKKATGDLIVLMDADYVFYDNYLETLANFDAVFFQGADNYIWTDRRQVQEYMQHKDVDALLRPNNGFVPFVSGQGYGGILCFDTNWYLDVFVGYIENFFRFGCEDVEAIERIMKLLGTDIRGLKMVKDTKIAHLCHGGKNHNLQFNARLKDAYVEQDYKELNRQLKEANVGNPAAPALIREYL